MFLALKQAAMNYITSNQNLFPCHPHGISFIRHNGSLLVHLDIKDKRCPSLLQVTGVHASRSADIVPFFRITSHQDRQIVSYMLGSNLCNLAEIREIDGSLFSRYAGSYSQLELVHGDQTESRIALWIHDCLTEDVDHSQSLNRYMCSGGACISYDFGLAFSNRSYPPFYAWELGLDDSTISDHAEFVMDLVSSYTAHLERSEEDFIADIRSRYGRIYHEGLCRFYIRSFRAHFPVRLYFGRFFEKISRTRFSHEKISHLAGLLGIHHEGCSDWRGFVTVLRENPRRNLHLEGLDLSCADLRGADLRCAVLRGANLQNADLERADIHNADIRGANLSGANLMNTNMEGVIR